MIDTLENVLNNLDIRKRNCKHEKNTVEYSLLRDAVFYLDQYQQLCDALGMAVKNSVHFREEEEC